MRDITISKLRAVLTVGSLGAFLALASSGLWAHTFTFNTALVSTGNNPQGVAAGDLNNDGRPDIVVANFNDNTISVLVANVDGSYQPHVDYQVGTNPIAVAVGDMNNDGKMDVVVVNNNCPTTPCTSAGSISVLLGNGDGTLQTHVDRTIGNSPNALALGDLNKDGKLDVVATNGQDNTMSFVIGNGDGTLKTNRTIPTGTTPHGVVLADFNGDLVLDAVVANTGDSNIGLLRGATNGFHTQVTFATGLNPSSLAVADFNQDGKPDVVTGNSGAASVSILINNAFFTGGFLPHVDLATTDKVTAVAAADFNNDGFFDVAAACTNSDVISLEYGRGDGTFQFHVEAPSGSDPVALASVDVTGDGLTDLLIANNVDNSVYILPSVSPKAAPGAVGTLGLQDMTTISVGNMPNGVAVGDFNKDGKFDLAIADRSDNNLLILLGNGDGTFSAQANKPTTGNKPSAAFAVDLNNDNVMDLVATNATDNTISVFLGNGDGSFQAGKTFSVGKRPVSIATGDFNGDGKQDLAIANQNDLNVSVLLGNGDGTFQAQKTYTTGPVSNPLWITTADFGNGKIDIATANNGSSSVAVLLGNGDGTFSLPVQYSAGSGPSCISFGDFNGDSKLDLAVTNSLSNTVSILLGNGNGTFQSHVDYPTAKGPFFVESPIVDVDGDGKLDLVIGASASSANRVSVLLGNGDGTFQFHQDHVAVSTSQGPSEALGVADFNGDGSPDIAAANQIANTVSVFLNNPVPVLAPGMINFGALNLGMPSSPVNVSLTDSGSAPLDNLSVSLTGLNPGDYSEVNTCGTSLVVNGSCAATVTFTASDVGTRSASLSFTDNAPTMTQNVALTAQGNGAGAMLNVSSLTFPVTLVGSSSVVQKVTLTNYGNMNLTFSTPTSSSTSYVASLGSCVSPLAPGKNCLFNVQFKPKTSGLLTGTISLADNAFNSPQTVSVSGTGTFGSLSPPSLAFTGQKVGTTSPPQTVTLTNTGTKAITIVLPLSFTGTNAGDFMVQSTTCTSSLAGGANCTINVVFTPTAVGSRSAVLNINDNGTGSPETVPVSGTGQ